MSKALLVRGINEKTKRSQVCPSLQYLIFFLKINSEVRSHHATMQSLGWKKIMILSLGINLSLVVAGLVQQIDQLQVEREYLEDGGGEYL